MGTDPGEAVKETVEQEASKTTGTSFEEAIAPIVEKLDRIATALETLAESKPDD